MGDGLSLRLVYLPSSLLFPRLTMFRLGAISGASAILLGAFGAHALRGRVEPNMLKTWETGAQYHLVHSVMLVIAATQHKPLATKLFAGGVLLFSGSLYALVLTDQKKLGAITPIGGLMLCAGMASANR